MKYFVFRRRFRCFRFAWQAWLDVTDAGRAARQVRSAQLLRPNCKYPCTAGIQSFSLLRDDLVWNKFIKSAQNRICVKMKRRIHIGFMLVCLLVSYFCSISAFYLPGLAPVSFCEEGKGAEDCQVWWIHEVSNSCIIIPVVGIRVVVGRGILISDYFPTSC